MKPRVYIATPCYDSMRVETCVSLIDTFSTLGKHGVECKFKSVKTSLVTHGRNLLTAGFLASEFDHMLFVDADVEFKPEAVMRMLVPKKDIICTPDLYYQEFKVEGPELRSYKHKFLRRLDHYHELIFDEKERAKVDSNQLLEEFENDKT